MLAYAVPAPFARPEGDLSAELVGLTARVAARERGAADDLARRLIPRVRRTVRALLGASSRDAFEDTVQSCLLEILRAAGSFRGESKLETWATSITIRHALKLVRRERRLSSVVDSEVEASQVADGRYGAPLAESLPRPIQGYLEELTEIHRVALVMRHGFGYSLEEIAQMTGTTANTVKARLRNGKIKLRELVLAESDDEENPDD